MIKRLRTQGILLVVAGMVFVVAGGVAYGKVQDGYGSLQAFSESQNVTLNYNEDGQLIDRGSVEEADNIKALLTEAWDYPVVESDLNPEDPTSIAGTPSRVRPAARRGAALPMGSLVSSALARSRTRHCSSAWALPVSRRALACSQCSRDSA